MSDEKLSEGSKEGSKSKNPVKRTKAGRPTKKELKRPVGRPKGSATIMNEYRDRMLASPKSKRVLEAIFDAALDSEHKNQAAAWKLVIDRIAPVAMFEKEVVKEGGRSAIQINITGVGDVNAKDMGVDMNNMSDVIEGEYEES